MMKSKTLVGFLVLLVGLSLLAGGALAASPKIKLTIVDPWGEVDAWAPLWVQFNQSHSNIAVSRNTITGGASTYQEVLKTGLASGTGADVFHEWGGSLSGVIIHAGDAEPLNRYYEKYHWKDILIPGAYQQVEQNSEAFGEKGKIYGVPITTNAITFWYNKKLWNKLDLQKPENYQQLEMLCEKVKKAGYYPLTIGGKYGWMTMRLFGYLLEVTAGPELHDKLLKMEVSWDCPAVIEAFSLLHKWVDKGWVVPGFLNVIPDPDSHQPLYLGKALMTLEGPWFAGEIKADGQDPSDYGLFINPTGHTPLRMSGFIEQYMISANKSPEVKDAAAEFINWFIQPKQQGWVINEGPHSTTATKGVTAKNQPLVSEALEALNKVGGLWLIQDQSLPEEVTHAYFEAQDEVAVGQLSPEGAAQKVQEAIESYKKGD